jgi:hypothetical protein
MKTIGITLFASALALLAGCSSGSSPASEDVADDAASNTESLRRGRHDDPSTDPCAAVRCAEGTHCEVVDGSATCAADDTGVNPCAAILCAVGTTCEVIDGEGVCTPAEPSGPFCGGIAAFECPGSGTCVDAPGDGCDPDRGGADCGGVCECNVRALCVQGFVFDESPEVCACVPDEPEVDACATVRCAAGTECVVVDERAECQPVAPPECAAVSCLEGTECVVVDGQAECQPVAPSECAAVLCLEGTQCVVVDGQAECQPVGPSDCAAVSCLEGNECVVIDGVASCQPIEPNPCAAVLCPVGTTCEVIDGAGVCSSNAPFCGGFAGIECNGAAECVDDPTDDCDPSNGGADCGGVCECNVLALCIEGFVFDSSPEVCECVPAPVEDPCALVDCFSGLICEVQNGEPVCVEPNPCATALILCAPDSVCVNRDGEAVCEPVDCD